MISADGTLDPGLEELVEDLWRNTAKIPTSLPPSHTPEEAEAVHLIAFIRELHQVTGDVRLPPEIYAKISEAASKTPEGLTPAQLVARILDRWFKENPNATIGIIP